MTAIERRFRYWVVRLGPPMPGQCGIVNYYRAGWARQALLGDTGLRARDRGAISPRVGAVRATGGPGRSHETG